MKRAAGLMLILIGIASIIFAAYPWILLQYHLIFNRSPYHYYYIDQAAVGPSLATAAVGTALIVLGGGLCSLKQNPDSWVD